MNRILLLLENKKNRDLLAAWLSMHYKVVADAEHALEQPFDVCIVDGPTLDRVWQQVQARKEREQPVFLPFVLITQLRTVDMVTRYLWQTVDELICLPIEKVELQARVEVLLRARRLSLELKLRTEDLESFFHALTHDLRSPLRAIRGFAEALAEDEGDRLSERGKHYVETIQRASVQMQELIDALVGFARLGREDLQLQQVELQAVIERCLRDVQEDIQAKQAQVSIKSPLPAVRAQSVLLKMALTNLLSNALKFVASGVRPEVTICAAVVQEVCRVQVQDNGIGIDLRNQPHLFTPFRQLHGAEEYPGIGLGLATVRKAVEMMGGRVGVVSVPGQGSSFWIELPSSR